MALAIAVSDDPEKLQQLFSGTLPPGVFRMVQEAIPAAIRVRDFVRFRIVKMSYVDGVFGFVESPCEVKATSHGTTKSRTGYSGNGRDGSGIVYSVMTATVAIRFS